MTNNMISLESKEYGTFLMLNLPWTEGKKGLGFGNFEKLEKA